MGEREVSKQGHVAAQAPALKLQRRLGLWSVTMAGVGVILGAGIYALIGPAAGQAGGAIWLAFVIAAVIAGLTGYSYARFAAMVPKNSPEFQYSSLAFGRTVGFAAGWLMIWADVISVAAVSLGFGAYLYHLLPIPATIGAISLVIILSAVAYMGIGQSIGLAVVFTLVELGGLVLIIAVGVPSWGNVNYLEMPKGVGGIWTAAALVFFAYLGFDELGNLAEETKRPERTLPRALFAAVILSSILYIAVSISAVSTVGWEELSSSPAPLAAVAGKVMGVRADLILTLIALAATANTVLLLIVAASRSLHGMASAGMLPVALTTVGGRSTPWLAILLTSVVAAGFALLGSLERVAQFTNAAVLLSFAVVNLGLFWLIYRRREGRNPRRTILAALPPLAAAGLCVGLLQYTGGQAIGLALVLALIGLAGGYWLRTRSREPGKPGSMPT